MKVRIALAEVLALASLVPAVLGLFVPGDLQPPPMMLLAVALVLIARVVSGIRPNAIWRWSAIAGFSLTAIAGGIALTAADAEGNLPPGFLAELMTALVWAAQVVIVPVLVGTGIYVRDLFGTLRSPVPHGAA